MYAVCLTFLPDFVGCYYTSDENTLCPFAFTTQRLRAAMCMDVCEENAYLYAAITVSRLAASFLFGKPTLVWESWVLYFMRVLSKQIRTSRFLKISRTELLLKYITKAYSRLNL